MFGYSIVKVAQVPGVPAQSPFRNWKTSLAGLGTAFFGFVLFSPDLFAQWPWLVVLAKYATAGGLAAIGLLGKDFNTHSTVQETQKSTASASVVAPPVVPEVEKK